MIESFLLEIVMRQAMFRSIVFVIERGMKISVCERDIFHDNK